MRFLLFFTLAACRAQHLEWIDAPAQGDVAALVQHELAKAQQDKKTLLVYVGAKWCEPCERFHRAAASGVLEPEFATLRFFAFDLDRDAARLRAAGYDSPLIPLLVRPDPSGRASDRRMFGSIKGEGAVAEMTPRLRALLAR